MVTATVIDAMMVEIFPLLPCEDIIIFLAKKDGKRSNCNVSAF